MLPECRGSAGIGKATEQVEANGNSVAVLGRRIQRVEAVVIYKGSTQTLTHENRKGQDTIIENHRSISLIREDQILPHLYHCRH